MVAKATKSRQTRRQAATKANGNGDGRLQVEYWPLGQIKPWGDNPQIHSPEQVAEIGRSIAGFGMVEPIIVRKADRQVIHGHGRLDALKAGGATEAPVIVVDLPPKRAHALALALNKIAEKSSWDPPKLAAIFAEIKDLQTDVELTGFSPEEIAGYVSPTAAEPDPRDDAVPEPPKKAITQPGDMWILGEHRLLCGDSTKAEDVERVMDGGKADIVSDPPYGINVDTSWLSSLNVKRGKPACKSNDRLRNDDGTLDLSSVFAFSRWLVFGFPYVARDERWTGLLIWDKRGDGGEGGIGCPVEVAATNCFNGYRLVRHLWAGYVREAGEERVEHPTQKPVGVMFDAISLASKDDVMDPYIGSGTTIIAAEKLGRRCYGLEIEPKYCDVIVERWQQFTGGKARREKA